MDNQNLYQNGVELEEPVTLKEWLITMLIMLIPCVNIVMMFVWAFSKDTKKSKSNFYKATLIFAAAGFVLSIIFSAAIGTIMVALFSSMM